jgi:hypothetical protein
MPDEWEKTGNVNFRGLTDSITGTPKQTEVRNIETGETRWVSGEAGDDDDDLGRHIADGDFEDD